jgi:hypothetical protein
VSGRAGHQTDTRMAAQRRWMRRGLGREGRDRVGSHRQPGGPRPRVHANAIVGPRARAQLRKARHKVLQTTTSRLVTAPSGNRRLRRGPSGRQTS